MIFPAKRSSYSRAVRTGTLAIVGIYAPSAPNSWAVQSSGQLTSSGGLRVNVASTLPPPPAPTTSDVVLCPTSSQIAAGAAWGVWNGQLNGTEIILGPVALSDFGAVAGATASAWPPLTQTYWIVLLTQLEQVLAAYIDNAALVQTLSNPQEISDTDVVYNTAQFNAPPAGTLLGFVVYDSIATTLEILGWIGAGKQCRVLRASAANGETATLPRSDAMLSFQARSMLYLQGGKTSAGYPFEITDLPTVAVINGTGTIGFLDALYSLPNFPKELTGESDYQLKIDVTGESR